MSMDDTTLRALQDQVVAFSEERDWARFHCPRNLAMALSVEAAELLELYLWSEDDGPQPAHPGRQERVADEMGDVLLCLLNLAWRAEVDLADALERKLAKARAKYPAGRVRGKALKYDEYGDEG